MRRALIVLLLLSLACDPPPSPPRVPHVDGGPLRDGGPGRDAGPRRDAGPPGPHLDGVVDDDDWEDGVRVEAEVDTERPGSTLRAMTALIEDDTLFLAIEGTIASGDALVVYVDRDFGGDEGVAPEDLADGEGALDRLLTQPDLTVPSGFAMDFAWGTVLAPHTAVGLDDASGWRDLASDPETYAWVEAEEAPSVCTADACETAIPFKRLGGTPPRTIALFARIVQADGALTNQTLPEDDPDDPAAVGQLLVIHEVPPMPDGGPPPDGGVDAGPDGIVVDGVLDEPEWALATVHQNTIAATPAFAGNSLSTLRALRDDTHLYVAIEATLTSGNAILMYVDHDLGGEDGLAAPLLDDFLGALDRALSKEFLLIAEGFRMDAAWGTTRMSHTGSDDTMGWREVWPDPSSYGVLSGASACSASACETSIALSELGAGPSHTIALAVRLGSAINLTLSNQTLPEAADAESLLDYAFIAP